MAEKPGTTSTPATKATEGGDHDRVVIASRHPDGSPAQTPDFTYIGDKDAAVAAAKAQLSEQAVSAADVRERGVAAAGAAGTAEPDPATQKLTEVHKKAAAAGEKAAESEVNARFEDVRE